MLISAVVLLVIVVAITIENVVGIRRLSFLSEISAELPSKPPRVSIIVAARNEEKNIEEALQSLLHLDYPEKELIVVNDRSTDSTGAVLNRMSQRHPEFRVLTIESLPDGWLGKNYAHYMGAAKSTGELLLFTDADIVMEATSLRRAVHLVLDRGLDHLAIVPEARMPGVVLPMVISGFSIFFNNYARPWKAADPKSKAFIGIGAFNFVRRSAYEKVGGHQTIRMRPDDDIKLGKIIKRAGFRQDFLIGTPMIVVEWYDSLRAMVHGLTKNTFAGVEYSLFLALAGILFQIGVFIWPYAALFLTEGITRLLYVLVCLIPMGLCWDGCRYRNERWLNALGFPFTCVVMVYITARSTFVTLWRNGIEWRGTHYPLAELKRNRV